VRLGNDILDNASLTEQQSNLAGWANSLSESADILIYGCNIGGTEDGLALMSGLSNITGADVAISDDNTGSESLHGDWELEKQTGVIETQALLSAAMQSDYEHILAMWDPITGILNIDYTSDKYTVDPDRYLSVEDLIQHAQNTGDTNISLREAIAAANNTAATQEITIVLDTINIPYTLTEFGSGEDAGVTGDLDITRDLTIQGKGQVQTVISAQASFANPGEDMRVIEVHGTANLHLDSLTISGGRSLDGGGGLRFNGGDSKLTNVKVDNNEVVGIAANTERGGGILVENAMLTIRGSTISNNSTELDGGGLQIGDYGDVNIINSTMNNNSAAVSGGAVFSQSAFKSYNTTFKLNTATNGGAAWIHNDELGTTGGYAEFHNSTISNNNATEIGGGVAVKGLAKFFNGTVVEKNTAGTDGGGLHIGSEANILNTTFRENTAGRDGGGIFMGPHTVTAEDMYVVGNNALSGAGGGMVIDGTYTIANSTFASNKATYGGGVQTLAWSNWVTNTTFFDNHATAHGGAINVGAGGFKTENVTIANNRADVGYGAVAVGNTSQIQFTNSIVSDNVSPTLELSQRVTSFGFNVITNDLDATTMLPNYETLYNEHFTDIVNRSTQEYVVDAHLDALPDGDFGSHAPHLKIGEMSDALDTGVGKDRVDAFGVHSNGYIDAGAVEYQHTEVANKIYFINSDDNSVYRINESGRGLQKILETQSFAGQNYELLDIAYDPKSHHIFLLGVRDNAGDDFYDVYYADAHGQNIDSLRLTLNTIENQPHIGYSLVVGDTGDLEPFNKLYIGARNTDTDSLSILEVELAFSENPDQYVMSSTLWANGVGNIVPQPINIERIGSLDTISNGPGPEDNHFAWADGNDAGDSDFIRYEKIPPTNAIIKPYNQPGYSDNEVEAVALDEEAPSFFGAYKDLVFRDEQDNGPGNYEASISRAASEDFDLAFDTIDDKLWYVDSNGQFGYYNYDLTANTEFVLPAGMKPSSLTLAAFSAVNTPPRVTTNTGLAVDEGDVLVPITTANLETTDEIGTNVTDPELLVYTLSATPKNGALVLKNINPAVAGTELQLNDTFTQKDIFDGLIAYTHDGSETTFDNMRLTVSDSTNETPNHSVTFSIQVTPVNDAPVINITASDLIVSENAASKDIATFTIDDPDNISPDFNVYVSDTATGTTSVNVTVTEGPPGVYTVSTAANLDHESLLGGFTFFIRADDGAAPAVNESLTVTVLDVNEAPTSNASNVTAPDVLEIAAWTYDIQSAAIPMFEDVDGDTLNFTVTNLDDTALPSWISHNNGVLTIAAGAATDALAGTTYDFKVVADDGTLSASPVTLSVPIIQINQAPTAINTQPVAPPIQVDENSAPSPVTTLTTTDPDAADTHTYSITAGNTNNHFIINNDKIELAPNVTLDHETIPSYTLQIRSEDVGGFSITSNVVINVVDVNEAPTANAASVTAPSFNELDAWSYNVQTDGITPMFNDEDMGTTLNYTVTNTDGSALPAWITHNNGTLEVAAGAATDALAGQNYQFLVVANDGVLSSTPVTLNFSINQINQNPTSVDAFDDLLAIQTAFTVDENSSPAIIATMRTEDPDLSDLGTHTYAITAGDTDGKFVMNGNKLELAASETLDFEATNSYNLTIESTDPGDLKVETTSLTINVNDINEAPTANSLNVTADDATELAAWTYNFQTNANGPMFDDVDAGTALTAH